MSGGGAGPEAFDLAEAVAVLERTPAVLRAMLAGLPEGWSRTTEGPGTWSPFDVVGHLLHGEGSDWMPRVRHVLAGERRPFDPVDREAHFAAAAGRSVDELLDAFADARRASLDELASLRLTADDLARTAVHPAFGEVTLRQLLATWTAHDLDHLGQVARVMAKRYRDAVGPWSAYLRILRDREPTA